LRAARRCGARVVYISARPRQRRKAFRLRWMRLIDEHWIAYPEFIAGSLGFVERLKLRLLGRPQVRYLDVILSRAAAGATDEDCASLPARLGLSATKYVLLVPGGGTGHPGAGDAVQQFVTAARGLAAGGVTAVLVGQGPAGAADSPPPLRLLGALPQSELAQLMRGARLVVANGGSTLLQAIACGRACIAVPIAGDQRERIRRCEQAGVAVAAALDARSIEDAAGTLLADARALEAQAARAVALGLADGVGVALRALEALVANRPGAQ
jgi:UDP:flavonoid glycosyltransferase YjiC (YdhE family)